MSAPHATATQLDFKTLIYAALSGMLFAVGLVLSGMTNPAKVVGFLNLAGLTQGISWTAQTGFWDPSLALVMGGALLVTLIAFKYIPVAGRKPWAAQTFELPLRTAIDIKLISGAALFGMGWGLSGYCPGPAIASVLTGGSDALMFTGAMLLGMYLAKRMRA